MNLFDDLPASVRPQDMGRLGAALNDPAASLELAMEAGGVEAWETDPWVPPALLDVECLPQFVIDPCVGKGAWADALRRRGHFVETVDLVDWTRHFSDVKRADHVTDWLSITADVLETVRDCGPEGFGVVMNPPFSGDDGLLSCAFVDKALKLGARKVVCFQRLAWRESGKRADWWRANPPARIWLCVDRATCWRFDVPQTCNNSCPERMAAEERSERKARGLVNGCRECMAGTTTAHAVYVWERGHRGAEMLHELRRAG